MSQAGLGSADPVADYDDGRLQVKPRDYVAVADGVVLRLTPRQLALLAELTSAPNRVRTREELLAAVWDGERDGSTRVVDVAVAHLRARLGEALPDRAYIHTHPRIGYRFAGEPARPPAAGAKESESRPRATPR